MSEKIISPGVFTQENDQTFLAAGVNQISAAFIGTTVIGQAFMPTLVTSANDYIAKFGGESEYSYMPYTIKNYLKDASSALVVRVLNNEGWLDTESTYPNDSFEIKDSAGNTAAILATTSGSTFPTITSISGSNNSFIIRTAGAGVSASFDLSSPNHIEKVFGTSPFNTTGNALASALYCYKIFKFNADTVKTSAPSGVVTSGSVINLTFDTNSSYSCAYTPYITSQNINSAVTNLFRFATISDGTSANKLYKIVVDNVSKPTSGSADYGTFNVVVREYSDTNNRPSVIETFTNVTLDPNSTNYILRKIGDKYTTIDSTGKISSTGEYNNKSKYIRVAAVSGLGTISSQVIPFGHAAYVNTYSSSTAPAIDMMSYQGTSDIYDVKIPWGIDFTSKDNAQFFDSVADNAGTMAASSFNLDNQFGHTSSSLYSGSLSGSTAPIEMLKFAVGFQSGYDGTAHNKPSYIGANIKATNLFGFDCSTQSTTGTLAFKKAINVISNPDQFDISMVVIPGLTQKLHPYITEHARQMCYNRADCFYLMDVVGLDDSIADAVDAVSGVDDNYSSTYYPWILVNNSSTNKQMWVPPSVSVSRAIAFSDKISAEWFAPAGLNRGGLSDATDIKNVLSYTDRNTLYEGRVNPIAQFPGQGINIWGQKTLQKKESALNRVNVRRLLITLKKFIASSARYIVFDPNTNTTRNQFLSIVNPYLESVKRNQGIYDFRVVMDETNNTPDVIDRNIIAGDIYIQPARAGEFIKISFNVLPTGSTFSD